MLPLIGYATRKYFEQLKNHLQQTGQKTFINSGIRKVLKEHPSKQKRFMIELQQYGLIRKVDGDKKKGFVYEVMTSEEYSNLRQSINGAMDEILSSLQVVQHSSKPLKAVQYLR